jgi:hypothetical protein
MAMLTDPPFIRRRSGKKTADLSEIHIAMQTLPMNAQCYCDNGSGRELTNFVHLEDMATSIKMAYSHEAVPSCN